MSRKTSPAQQKKPAAFTFLQAEPERSTRLRRAGKALQALRQSKQGEPSQGNHRCGPSGDLLHSHGSHDP